MNDAVKAMVALDAGEAHLVVSNSLDVTVGMSRRMDVKLIWVMQDLDDSEGLIVHNKYHWDHCGSTCGKVRIMEPRDLRGRKVGVWWASSQHYGLTRMLEQMNIPYHTNLDYQYEAVPASIGPVHWAPDETKVTLIPLTRDELWEKWIAINSSPETQDTDPKAIHACWVGFPHWYYFKQNGTVLATNRMLADWRMVTFDAFIINRYWMDNPPAPPGKSMNVRSFLRTFLAEMAKANFYFHNNTKEFAMGHRVTKGVLETSQTRVDGEIAGVIGSLTYLTWPHIQLYKYPTIKEQLSCIWLGCGNRSRVAWALRDQAKFLKTVSYGGIAAGSRMRGLEDGTVGDVNVYANYIDTEIMNDLSNNDVDGSYELVPGEEVEFGYHDDYAE